MTLNELIASTLRIPASRVTDETAMKDVLEWDSLKHMELIVAIEQTYAIELTGDEIALMTSVKAMRNTLGKYGK